jgi:hypothetical protein
MEYRFLVRHGHHRIGAAAALGMTTIPAHVSHGAIINVKDLEHWPQVRIGVWSREQALGYFHHLFDFDSSALSSVIVRLTRCILVDADFR